MKKYKAYPKQLLASMLDDPQLSGKSLFQLWEEGAKELEKTAPGRLITAPIRLPAAVVTSTQKTVEEVPGVVKTVSKTIPFLVVAAAIGGSAYLLYRLKGKGINAATSAEKVVL